MTITAKDVKSLRDSTGAGMMDCKKALAEAGGDLEAAIDYLRKKGLAKAAKKAGRIAADGLVGCFVSDTGKSAAVVEVNCETDFVAKNDDFKNFVSSISKYVNENNFSNNDELLASNYGEATLTDELNNLTLKIGEKIAIRRFHKLKTDGYIGSYSHGGKIGVLLEVAPESDVSSNPEFKEMVKNVCMHVAASDTRFINENEIDENFKNREAEIYAAQLKDQGKPEEMIPKIVQGKLSKMASEICLMKQKFVMDPDKTVEKYISEASKKFGANVSVKNFYKFNLGEGIEKKQDNLAEEVAKMTRS